MPSNLQGLIWLLVVLGPFLVLQRRLHQEVQAVFLLLTRRSDITIVLFSLLFFPGILLHEGSHYLVARLLGVRTGRFSLLPRPLPDGRLQLGFVETSPTDWVRDALIGIAPLVTGGLFVAYAGLERLHMLDIWGQLLSSDLATLLQVINSIVSMQDFWLWFYLTVALSSTMLPSASDRRSWLPLLVMFSLLLGIGLLAGFGPWLVEHLAEPFNRALQSVAVVFSISLIVHLVLLLPIWGVRRLLSWFLGVKIF